MNRFYALDIETASNTKGNDYALEAYRLPQGKARITSIACSGPDGYFIQLDERSNNLAEIGSVLEYLRGKEVFAHRGVFDVGWLIAQTGNYQLLLDIKWRDSMLLAKWLVNGQVADMYRWSLALRDVVDRYIDEHPDLEEFLDLKKAEATPGEDYEYWLKRGRMDAEFTHLVAETMWDLLPDAQKPGYIYEQANIVPVANSWLMGLHTNLKATEEFKPKIQKFQKMLAKRIDQTEACLRSPQQLAHLLFTVKKFPVQQRTPKGKPSANKDSLLLLEDKLAGTEDAHFLRTILDFKKLATMESKFVNGILNSAAYNGDPYTHAFPNIFGTYTGRYTYVAKTRKKWPSGIANHQLPRQGPIRGLLTAPEGYVVCELDGEQQELRFVGQISGDTNLIYDFNSDIDVHSSMTSFISAIPYETLLELLEDEAAAGHKEAVNYRYAGKLLNLSCQYRIGAKALAYKFFTTYGINITKGEAYRYLSMYKSRYKGVVDYWNRAIADAKRDGYAESIGGRRFKLKMWSGKYEYRTEQSAINFPIQGSGGDHKNAAISIIARKFPEAIFVLDLHDGIWYYLPEDGSVELAREMRDELNRTNWSRLWSRDIKLPLPFGAKVGPSFGEVKTV
ncbi:MAG: DNA polymerase [Acidimicrobiia bacterium]|nr:DNA polymerase [Acidimicrobiia bacterium]